MTFKTYTATAVVLTAMAIPVFAQQPPTPPQPPVARRIERQDSARPRMLNVEAALRFKQELKLSDSQVAQLETLRKEIVAERQAQARDAIDTQSRVMAGLLSEEDVRKQFEGKRDQHRQSMQQKQERIAKILTADQQQELRHQTRDFMMDRMQDRMRERWGRMGPGMRGRDRMLPGMRMRERMWRPGFMPAPPRPPRGFDDDSGQP